MEAGFTTHMLTSTRRRLVGLSIFWVLFATALVVANGAGFIDAAISIDVVR